MKHTQEEIVARIEAIKFQDPFGTQRGELISALTLTNAQPFLKPEYWSEWKATTEEGLLTAAKEYLSFAVGKMLDHRGLSAVRSVDHYLGWVWLLAPERYEEFRSHSYPNYGAPQIKLATEIFGFPEAWSKIVTPELANMALGVPCVPGCTEGCAL